MVDLQLQEQFEIFTQFPLFVLYLHFINQKTITKNFDKNNQTYLHRQLPID